MNPPTGWAGPGQSERRETSGLSCQMPEKGEGGGPDYWLLVCDMLLPRSLGIAAFGAVFLLANLEEVIFEPVSRNSISVGPGFCVCVGAGRVWVGRSRPISFSANIGSLTPELLCSEKEPQRIQKLKALTLVWPWMTTWLG